MDELEVGEGAIEGGALVRGLADDKSVRVIAADVRLSAAEAKRLHELTPSAAELCAQGMVAAALLSAHIKGSERITVQIQANEPKMSFFAEIDADGHIRSRISPSSASLGPSRTMRGIMLTIKADADREMYRGLTEIEDQTLEEALEHHLRASSQIDAVLRIETSSDEDGVRVACGILMERLPEDRDRPSMQPEAFAERYRGLPAGAAAELVDGLRLCKLAGVGFSPLEDRGIVWQCRCSEERVENMLYGLGPDELRAMIEEDHGAEVTCHFCNTVFSFSEARLRGMLAQPQSPGSDA